MEYKAVYKCRLCGKVYQNGTTTGEAIAEASLQELHMGLCGTVAMAPRMTETHHCRGGSLGVAVFQGWQPAVSPYTGEKNESGLLED